MKTLTVRLPDALAARLEVEARRRRLSKSDLVRERLEAGDEGRRRRSRSLDAIADLIGSVDGLPEDLSERKRDYLRKTGYGRKRPR